MFKKIFGPKKTEGIGEPVPPAELRTALQALFPSEGEVNAHLSIEKNEKSPEGFNAVWRMYIKESDAEDTFRYHYYMLTHKLSVDIDPQEKAVRFKISQNKKSARVAQGETVYDPWYGQVKVGELQDLKAQAAAESAKRSYSYSTKKLTEPLVSCATALGWDAYA